MPNTYDPRVDKYVMSVPVSHKRMVHIVWVIRFNKRRVGVADRYRLGGPGIASRWGWAFLHPSIPPLEPTQPPIWWMPFVFRGYSGRGVALTRTPSKAEVKERVELICLLPLWAFLACSRVDFIFTYIKQRPGETFKPRIWSEDWEFINRSFRLDKILQWV
jgi:hypothetical protein